MTTPPEPRDPPEPDDGELVLYSEVGSSWWPVLIGPGLGLAGGLAESTAPGGAFWPLWIGFAVLVGGPLALVVRVRRRLLRVVLTPHVLVQGEETLPVRDIARVAPDDRGGGLGMRVLGEHPAVPRRYDAVPLVLTDGSYRAAWAQDGDGLRRALRPLVPAAGTRDSRPGPPAVEPTERNGPEPESSA